MRRRYFYNINSEEKVLKRISKIKALKNYMTFFSLLKKNYKKSTPQQWLKNISFI